MFSQGLPNELLIRTRHDADFGTLELWRWQCDSPTFFEWRGRLVGEDDHEVALSIPAEASNPESVFGIIDGVMRDTYRTFAMRPANVRLAVAKYELSHAEDWAYQADLPPPTQEEFSSSLQISQIVVRADAERPRFEIWLAETTTEFFAGHSILATFDAQGSLQGAGLG